MLKDFIRISQYAGNRFDLTQANGGNSSVKIDGHIFIKSSGYYLSDVGEKTAFSKVKLKPMQELFGSVEKFTVKQIQNAVKSNVESGSYPSIEIGMHVLLGKLVLHTHPLIVNALTCHKDAQAILRKLFPQAIFVTYATPGVGLVRAVSKALKNEKADVSKTLILFLQNHGLVVSADNVETIINETERVTEEIEKYLAVDFAKYKLAEKVCDFVGKVSRLYNFCHCCEDHELYDLWRNEKALFFQDYCIPAAYVYNTIALEARNLEDEGQIHNYIKAHIRAPQVLIYQNRIYILAANIKTALEIESTLKEHLLLHKIVKDNVRTLTLEEKQGIDEELLS